MSPVQEMKGGRGKCIFYGSLPQETGGLTPMKKHTSTGHSAVKILTQAFICIKKPVMLRYPLAKRHEKRTRHMKPYVFLRRFIMIIILNERVSIKKIIKSHFTFAIRF